MTESSVRVEFAGSTGEVVALQAHPVEGGYLLDEASADLPGVNPGDLVTAETSSGRLLFTGGYTIGPNRSGAFLAAQEVLGEVLSALSPLCLFVEPHHDHHHFVCAASQQDAVRELLARYEDAGEVELSWDDSPGENAAVLAVGSLDSLGRIFAALTRDEVANAKSGCGHLHSWHILGALESPGEPPEDEESPAFEELPAVLSRRLPVDVGRAVLVDDRAVEALGDLATPYASVLDVEVHLSRTQEDHRPEGLWVEAVLGVYDEEENLETVAFVDAPFDLHGSRLHLAKSAGLGMTMWATRVRDHDEGVLCYYLAPLDPSEVSSPLARALEETHDKLRSALRDYALVHLVQERDSLLDTLHGDQPS